MPTAAKESPADRPKRRVGHPRVAPEPGGGTAPTAEPRDQILAAAAELFTVQGYTATREMRELLRESYRLAECSEPDAARLHGLRLCAEWIGRSERLPTTTPAKDRA